MAARTSLTPDSGPCTLAPSEHLVDPTYIHKGTHTRRPFCLYSIPSKCVRRYRTMLSHFTSYTYVTEHSDRECATVIRSAVLHTVWYTVVEYAHT